MHGSRLTRRVPRRDAWLLTLGARIGEHDEPNNFDSMWRRQPFYRTSGCQHAEAWVRLIDFKGQSYFVVRTVAEEHLRHGVFR